MEKIGDFLDDALNNRAVSQASKSAQICFWADEWGKGRFSPISFSRGVLKVSVDSAAAAQELQMECGKLLKHLNLKCKFAMVKQIRIENHS